MNLLNFPSQLTVLVPYFNYANYKSRKRLHVQFIEYLQQFNLPYIEVESSLDGNFFTSGLHFRADHELWHKENLLNRALPYVTTPYVAWIDADLLFSDPLWPQKTIAKLQNHQIIQLFSESYDLDPKCQILQSSFKPSYAYRTVNIHPRDFHQIFNHTRNYLSNVIECPLRAKPIHPGFAWAAQTDFLRSIGGFLDTISAGCGDRWMADIFALSYFKHHVMSQETFDLVLNRYVKNEADYIKMFGMEDYLDTLLDTPLKLGYIDNTVYHYYHGSKNNRGYVDRIKALVNLQYSNDLLEKNSDGLYRIKPTATGETIIDYLKSYFVQRQEDDE
jgi:hypothetical protein